MYLKNKPSPSQPCLCTLSGAVTWKINSFMTLTSSATFQPASTQWQETGTLKPRWIKSNPSPALSWLTWQEWRLNYWFLWRSGENVVARFVAPTKIWVQFVLAERKLGEIHFIMWSCCGRTSLKGNLRRTLWVTGETGISDEPLEVVPCDLQSRRNRSNSWPEKVRVTEHIRCVSLCVAC